MSRKTQRNRPGPEARSSQSLPGTGGRRNGGRGILSSDGLVNLDANLMKNFRLGER